MRYWFSIAATAAILAASAACGGSSGAKATPMPTAASTTTVAPSPAAAGAQPDVPPAAVTAVSGTIQSVAPDKLTMTDGSTIGLTPTTRLVHQDTIQTSGLKTGDFVAITAKRQPDNSLLASIVSIFPPSLSNASGGQSPLPEGNLMTNATIDSISGNNFTVTFPGGGAKIQIAPGAQLLKLTDATNADLKPGLKVTARVTGGAARFVTIQ